jgi:DNA-binding protein H-NS
MTTSETIPSIEELEAKQRAFIENAEAIALLIQKRREAEKEERIAEAKAFMAKHGLTQADLFGSAVMETTTAAVKSARKERVKYLVPRFVNPATKEDWSGMGRNPDWLLNAIEKEGKKKEDFVNPEWTKLYGSVKDKKKKPAKSVAPEQAAA